MANAVIALPAALLPTDMHISMIGMLSMHADLQAACLSVLYPKY